MSDSATEQRRTAWENRYQEGRMRWDRGAVSPALEHWLQTRLAYPCRLLVPGAGSGYEVAHLAERGFDVTAVDVAPTAVQRLSQLLASRDLKASVVQADLLDWNPDTPFEVIYEQTCLCALDPPDWPAYAQSLWQWLRPAGRLLASFMQTGQPGGPPYHCDLTVMRELFPDNRWIWPGDQPLKIPHPNGLVEFGMVLVRRGAPAD
ncbi:MAG: TPMT family class I SAM-dependent methyltransferase [Gammaproteobacteria bacterium]|jgi:SAM-dependent methyltransferase|nr:TPMT family class I SAM-dependent methyltransferase [Gammaproteobacteria bacterium]